MTISTDTKILSTNILMTPEMGAVKVTDALTLVAGLIVLQGKGMRGTVASKF